MTRVSRIEARSEQQQRIERWLALDPDAGTQAELAALMTDDPGAAAARFEGRVAFGTAGLRAPMGPGPTAMNRLVVRQTSAGLMRWLTPGSTVVVGYDARHRSARFAADVAAVVAGAGGRAELLSQPLPTPVLAHAVIDRGADAGVMITASHNPAADNGYKLYLGDGIQIVDPAASEIAARIDEVAGEMADGAIDAIPFDEGSVVVLGDEPARRHLAAAVAACTTDRRDVRVVYTAMHGVGGRHLLAAFDAAGFPPPMVVAEQFDPDPDFPTVAFPNPEEPGALDLAVATAEALVADGGRVDLIVANDPDADRLAVAAPAPDGRWRRLTGDQLGALLADHLIATTTGDDRLVASSIVSSRQIEAIAAAAGVVSVRTLTGFKWVARPIVERPDRRYLFGYEEALGYCVGDRVRDKDGISAALVVAELVAAARADGRSPFDLLADLDRRHGPYRTAPVTLRFDGHDGAGRRAAAMEAAAADPPQELAGVPVTSTEDLGRGGDLPPTTGVVWHLADRSRVVVRPSGTEPKLKAYVEVLGPAAADGRAIDGDAIDSVDGHLEALVAAVEQRLR
ncbi:MAG: phospho-sugar mutase [Acidimicrobiales bacterium]